MSDPHDLPSYLSVLTIAIDTVTQPHAGLAFAASSLFFALDYLVIEAICCIALALETMLWEFLFSP